MEGAKELVQSTVALIPELLVAGEPGRRLAEGFGLQMAEPGRRSAGARDQAGVLEHLEVPGDGRLRHRERGREVPDRKVTLGEASEDRAAGGIRERPEHRAELVNRHQ